MRRVAHLHGALQNDREYTAARTKGGGACALHACWGSKSQCPLEYGGGQWYDCGDARSRLLAILPDDEDDVLNGHYSQAFTKVVRQVWLDVIAQLRVFIQERGRSESAPSSLRLGDGGGVDNEACCLWDTLQAEARAQIYSFVIGLLGEERQKRDILQELRSYAREIFNRDNESLVERLCIDLGYIDQADAPKLCQGQQQAQRDPLELYRGAVSYLMVCRAMKHCTYQIVASTRQYSSQTRSTMRTSIAHSLGRGGAVWCAYWRT